MAQLSRLCYAPKAYVFTKAADGTLYNLTPYVTQGEVQLNVNQVSSAAITLRNPYKIFTTPSAGVAFHPQDPITIYLERIAGYPVRVFTGYLDNTPYYQLQPGVIQLQASCTLKRLLYTFFDPSLPYMISFFTKYGWINTGSGSIISSATFNNGTTGNNQQQASKNPSSLNDGSLGKLLWAVLYDIGQWDDTNIWVEPMPKTIVERMQALMTSMDQTEQAAANYFSQFLSAVIGTGGQGTGGGGAGGGTGIFTGGPLASGAGLTVKGSAMNPTQVHFANLILAEGQQLGASPLACAVVMLQAICESGLGEDMNWNPTYGGLLAGNVNTFGHLGAANSDAVAQAEITSAFKGGNGYNYPGGALAASGSNIMTIAEQNAGCGNQYTQESGYTPNWIQEAVNIVSAGQKNNGTNGSTGGQKGTKNQPGQSTTSATGGVQTQTGSTAPSSGPLGSTTVYDCVVMAANALASSGLPYKEQHLGSYAQKWPFYDCSGSVGYCLYSAGLLGATDVVFTGNEIQTLGSKVVPGYDSSPGAVNIINNAAIHTFMEIGGSNGRFWGTTDGSQVSSQGAGAWLSPASATPGNMPPAGSNSSGFNVYHIPQSILQRQQTYQGPIPAGGTGIPNSGQTGTTGSGVTGTAGGSGSTGQTTGNASAEAFVAQLQFPSVEDSVTAVILGSEGKGLMHDQSLMPFVQQICQASLRNFMSLPNGDFFAFYPDYFGEMGHRAPYWMIDDLEIISGTIGLTDDALATHVFAVGDNTLLDALPGGGGNTELMNEMFSAGTISVFNAFLSEGIIQTGTGRKKTVSSPTNGLADVMNSKEAVDFVKRYGARPLVQNYPQVRSSLFEMLLAYQMFMTAWANQFISPFTFTFMPELFPGGKVGFPGHGLQMYVNQVTHSWDYSDAGFTTTAQLSAPSILANSPSNPDLPPNMVAAMAEPIKRKQPSGNAASIEGAAQALANTVQSTASIDQQIQQITGTDLSTISNPWDSAAPTDPPTTGP